MTTVDQLERWQRVREHLCWSSTGLAVALAGLAFVQAPPHIPTARCTARGTVFVNVGWSAQQTTGEVAFTILHFTLHLVLRHQDRRDGRSAGLWGVAADLVINDVIEDLWSALRNRDRHATPVTRPASALWRARDTPWIDAGQAVEGVYAKLDDHSFPWPGSGSAPGAGCEIDDLLQDPANALSEAEWHDIQDSIARASRDSLHSPLRPLFEPVTPTIRWGALLRGTMASAAAGAPRDRMSWSRRNRRSPAHAILPGGVSTARQVAVVIDSSASMSDRDLSTCITETRAAVIASQTSAYLVVHDHVVQTATWITPTAPLGDIAALVVGRGSTLFQPAYEAVAAVRKRFSTLIHFTDGCPCDPWPARPINCQDSIAAITLVDRSPPPGWRLARVTVR